MAVEKLTKFNRERVLWCCLQNSVTLEQLSDDLDIALATLQSALYDDGSLTVNQLQKISEYFHRNLLFFFETGTVDEEKADSAQFRTINNQKPQLARKVKILIKRAEEQRKVFVDLLEEDDEYMKTRWVEARIQKDSQETIKDFANRARAWLRLDNQNTFASYRRALEKAGFLVFVTNGYNGKWKIDNDSPVRGFSLYFDLYPVIVSKKQESPAAQCFTVMHELGHLLLHSRSFIDEAKDFHIYKGHEREANEFAGNLLVPDALLYQVDLLRFPFESVERYDHHLLPYRNAWGVSGDVIVRRLHDEGELTKELYEAYLTHKNSLPPREAARGTRIRDKEPLNIFGGAFVSVVLDALHSEQITANKASKYLDNIKLTDLRKLEQRLVHL